MAYRKINWQNRRVERPRTYNVTQNADGSVTLTDAPGEITQDGTPLSPDNLNRKEEAMQHMFFAFAELACIIQAVMRATRPLTNEEIDLAIERAEKEEAEEEQTDGL